MPKAPTPTTGDVATIPRKRKVDWKKFGARQPDDGERPTWRPSDVDDTITAVLGRVDEANTRFGSKVIIELEDCSDVIAGGTAGEAGPYAVWPTPGLLNALDASEADQGDTITITLTDLIDTGKGNPFKQFEVSVADATAEPF